MKEIKVLKANKEHKKFIIYANNRINNVNDTEQTNGLEQILIEIIFAIILNFNV